MPNEQEAQPLRRGGFLLSQAHQLTSRRFDLLLREQGLEGLTAARGRIVFALLETDGISQSELSARTRLEKSGLALTLKELERDGLIRRQRDVLDQRKTMVFRAEAFAQLLERFQQVSQQMVEEFYQGFTSAEIQQFESSLERIIANLA